jgi:hypothetical protein
MIALLPQKGQRHRSANGVADEEQSQWVSGCFIGGTLLEDQTLGQPPPSKALADLRPTRSAKCRTDYWTSLARRRLNSASVIDPAFLRRSSFSLVSGAETNDTPKLIARLLSLLGISLSHPTALRDQVHKHGKEREYDQPYDPECFPPAGDIMTPEQVHEYCDEQWASQKNDFF